MQGLIAVDASMATMETIAVKRCMVLPRHPISELSDSEWNDYINILKAARNFSSGYFVFLEEPSAPNTDLRTLRKTVVNLYDLFIWQHHYSAKDSENELSEPNFIDVYRLKLCRMLLKQLSPIFGHFYIGDII